jgi:hypothetical protein
MELEEKQNMQQSYSLFGMFTLALRLVVGWTRWLTSGPLQSAIMY